ncbi:MAG TPA: FAD:protein FMN transferase [Fimbriiglobus sp.]|jgi:thiamine biosynthesis lipoprotein
MATTFEVALPYGAPHAVAAAEAALDLIDAVEDQLTVFRDSSEVVNVNARAASEAVPVSDSLFQLLETSASLSQETGGAFDPATGAMTKAWGFYRREGRVPPPAERKAGMHASGMRHVLLDRENQTVKFRRPGLEMNFGGIGKGYALDRAAEILRREWGIRSALLHGGGSSVYAIGHPPGQPEGWVIDLKHPTDDRRTLGSVRLKDEGLGTSAATFQYFVYKGKKLGHVLDPRAGWPARGIAAATVIAPTAATADAYSTAAFVQGIEIANEFFLARPHLGAVLLSEDEVAVPVICNLTMDRFIPPA